MSHHLINLVKEIKKIFTLGKIKYCLIGGLAVSVRVGERTTKDIDFAISVINDEEAESIIRYLISCGLIIETLLENKNSNNISIVRLKYLAGPNYFIDLLFSASGVENEIVQSSTEMELLPNLFIPVATTPSLLVMKLISVDPEIRPTDVADINLLVAALTKDEELFARKLIMLSTQRGYNRNRDLEKMLDDKIKRIR